MFNDFFRGKRILVTGAAGVKATWLALELLDAGSTVTGVDIRQPEDDSNFVASNLHERIDFVQGDINDLSLMRRLLDEADGVFNLAAVSLVGEARRNPLEAYRTNTLGVATVLEAIRLSPRVRYAVFATTDKVYKSKDGRPWVEDDPLFASDPYPVSKACAEEIIADYYRTYLEARGTRVAVGRAGNVLLGGDPGSSRRTGGAGHLHVDCFEALAEGRQPELFAPAFTRPYTYGLDILCGYMTLMSRLDDPGTSGQAFNFGPHEREGIENGVIASKICALWASGITWRSVAERAEPFDKQSLGWTKARQHLRWQPAYDIDATLAELTRWYKEWARMGCVLHAGSMVALNRSLIDAHRSAAAERGIAWATESSMTGSTAVS
jgi:CDP-glucose 4,6-dehydratase